jgi:LysM repeat protein
MGISRKDTIILAVFVNVALLGLLFALASTKQSTHEELGRELSITAQEEKLAKTEDAPSEQLLAASFRPVDEIDEVLQEYALKNDSCPITLETKKEAIKKEAIVKQSGDGIVVKKGDTLGKIAIEHNVSVEDLMQANHLENSKLKIGQVLQVPQEVSRAIEEAQYYIMKSGDNPWKIARRFKLKFEDLLKLNNLDEERAKNLKIGEKIRIK